ncbi:tripartite tricarboxylate transporter TctB family protein [Chelativorans sp. AA-79]|uniref:tripartite tricarboxylate transporter TctB family protein n=1 Tax=Chelativorans sp. AA-79 TaxID=3028735 RepID=UPI0023F91E22|nr:tripartite tricarboxylate transporter TctB family protein [Chelativorans sp. AA-79]WEX08104.1 tripartite tricarboxylate transporter TctB family protein [Chelativorans sp. AA-79]
MNERPGSRWSPRNLVFSAIFLVISLVAGGYALATMKTGAPAAMGPGFFPVMLSIVLGLLSIGVAFLPRDIEAEALTVAPLKATIIILACPMIFGFAIEPFGLVIAVSLVIFVSCLASRITTLRQALVLSAVFTLFCVLIFHYLLHMPIPLWGELFTG